MPENAAYGWGPQPLTPHELSRLRPTVDSAALEALVALLAAAGYLGVRRLLITHFATEATFDDARAALAEPDAGTIMPGADRDAVARALAAREAELVAEWRARHPEASPDTPVPPLPLPPGLLRVGLPPDLAGPHAPVIRGFWAAVEPSAAEAPASGGRSNRGRRREPRLCDACGLREATVTVFRGGGDTPDGHVHIDAADLPPGVRRLFEELARAQRDRPPAPRLDEPRTEKHLCEMCARQQRRSA